MKDIKAKPTGFKQYDKYSTMVEYEYRGHKYDVTYSNAMDYVITNPKIQHLDAQKRIDNIIDNKNTNKEEHSQIGLDMFFNSTE